VKLVFSRPGKPVDNAFIESFNGRLRDECLNANWFYSLAEAKKISESWIKDYNEERPHSGLGGLTPIEYETGARPPAQGTRGSSRARLERKSRRL
jgi:putative transposase